jgi:hypothetical protein
MFHRIVVAFLLAFCLAVLAGVVIIGWIWNL